MAEVESPVDRQASALVNTGFTAVLDAAFDFEIVPLIAELSDNFVVVSAMVERLLRLSTSADPDFAGSVVDDGVAAVEVPIPAASDAKEAVKFAAFISEPPSALSVSRV